MNNPDWFILLERWKPEGMGEWGVTLPFLVGALAYKANQQDVGEQHVRNVLDDIIQHPVVGYVTEIRWCPDIDAPVISTCQLDGDRCRFSGFLTRERIRSNVFFPRSSGEGESLVFSEDIQSMLHLGCKDANACLDRLVENAADPVSKGQYSKQKKGGYVSFQRKDLDYIQKAIMIP